MICLYGINDNQRKNVQLPYVLSGGYELFIIIFYIIVWCIDFWNYEGFIYHAYIHVTVYI